jgi:hypothetical protein
LTLELHLDAAEAGILEAIRRRRNLPSMDVALRALIADAAVLPAARAVSAEDEARAGPEAPPY